MFFEKRNILHDANVMNVIKQLSLEDDTPYELYMMSRISP